MKGGNIRHAGTVGFVLVLVYAVCLAWGGLLTDPAVIELHGNLLKLALPGFVGLDAVSIIWGAGLSFAYGFIVSYVFHALHAGCCNGKK